MAIKIIPLFFQTEIDFYHAFYNKCNPGKIIAFTSCVFPWNFCHPLFNSLKPLLLLLLLLLFVVTSFYSMKNNKKNIYSHPLTVMPDCSLFFLPIPHNFTVNSFSSFSSTHIAKQLKIWKLLLPNCNLQHCMKACLCMWLYWWQLVYPCFGWHFLILLVSFSPTPG